MAAFRMVTGRIGEMQNKKINVSTPFAALAVRGTDFWWGQVEGQNGALLVSNSRLDVRGDKCDKEDRSDKDRERCRCAVTLNRAEWGTDIKDGCPGAAYQWPPGKVAAALSSTTFGLASLGSGLVPAAAGAAVAAGAFVGSTAGSNNPPPKVGDLINSPPNECPDVAPALKAQNPECPPPDGGGGNDPPPVDPEGE